MVATMDIQVDTAEADALFAQMERNRATLGKSCRESLQWGGRLLCQSLAARTTVSKKKREVVSIPIQRITKENEVDRRYAPYGMKRWKRGVQDIVPLAGYGKGGYTRYKSLSEASKDRRVKIGRRGLAKKSWAWAAMNMAMGGEAMLMRVPDVASVSWSGGYVTPAVRITNRLRYMEHALMGGYSAVESAFQAAANKMEHEITRKASEAYGAAQ